MSILRNLLLLIGLVTALRGTDGRVREKIFSAYARAAMVTLLRQRSCE